MGYLFRRRCKALWFLSVLGLALTSTWARKTPEAASTALQLHKLYTVQPPHDMSLYNVLQVSPNATAAQITKSYRRRSRLYHPDKTRHNMHKTNKPHPREQLEQVQQAYEILNDDATRLPYHQYGLTDPNVAVFLLLGPHHQNHPLQDSLYQELLQLMGYDSANHELVLNADPTARRQHRVRLLAARLVEVLRPIVEETVDPYLVAHCLAQDCDRWKALPLGAQIVRCVGRAYRHAGQDFLKTNSRSKKKALSVPMRQQWRQAKNFWTAVLATGRATVTEQVWTQQEKRRRRKQKRADSTLHALDYQGRDLGSADFLEDGSDEEDMRLESEEEIRQAALLKAQQTLLTSLQVEALWKIAKIDLDKAVRQACNLILTGEYFFFPSHQLSRPYSEATTRGTHGWVTASGKVLHAEEARYKAAEAMVRLGNIMVQRSKEGTSWKD